MQPIFSTMLKGNNHFHPMIYMRGTKAKNLAAIVDFIYNGEPKIFQKDMGGFLALAEELKLKGLAYKYPEYTILDIDADHTEVTGQKHQH